ncbi:MAG: class I SAM-dependent methyltransferase [Bacteroidia bacterium]
MKYLNLGCGSHYSTSKEWTNMDFISNSEYVIAHNLLNGIPFESNSFDAVYHSHVLEHFSKADGEKFISECLRVLKPGGILRIAIPDLERIARKYLELLEKGIQNPGDIINKANYEWMLIEMYDQTVRNSTGGNMGKYLFQETIINEDFVFERIGEEGKSIRNQYLKSKENNKPVVTNKHSPGIKARIKNKIKDYLLKKLDIDLIAMQTGKFRFGGEIHQWMYDRYSLALLLKSMNTEQFQVRDPFTSYISNWDSYELDGKNGIARKPDSLYVEALKKR